MSDHIFSRFCHSNGLSQVFPPQGSIRRQWDPEPRVESSWEASSSVGYDLEDGEHSSPLEAIKSLEAGIPFLVVHVGSWRVSLVPDPFAHCSSLSFVYPHGATLNVQKPAIPILSSGTASYPLSRPLGALFKVRESLADSHQLNSLESRQTCCHWIHQDVFR